MSNLDPKTDDIAARAAEYVQSKGFPRGRIAVVLGSGLGSYASLLSNRLSVATSDIPNYPISTVPGHAGQIHTGIVVRGKTKSSQLLVFQGRVHPYEGAEPDIFALNIRIAARLGATHVLLTNAAGGIRRDLLPGTLMLHSGLMHIPTRRFTSMRVEEVAESPFGEDTYDVNVRAIIRNQAKRLGLALTEGTYCYYSGPTYETPAEVGMLDAIGADAVGMSTYPEVQEARRLGMRVAGLSLISNQAAGLSPSPLSHEDVTKVAREAGNRLSDLVTASLISLS